jgi:hypothetical protein
MSKLLSNIKIRHYLQVLGLLIIDLLFFGNTNTNKDPSFIVIIGFILLMMTIYLVVFAIISFLKLYGLPVKNKKRIAIYISALFAVLTALQSIGELTSKDVLVLLPIAVIGYLYVGYTKPNRKKSE